MRASFAILTTIFCIVSASAQECVDIARVIGRDLERYGDKSQVEIVQKAQLCSSEWDMATSDQRAQIQAAYGLFNGGASGSDQQVRQSQKDRCEGHFGSFWYSRIQDTELNRVSQSGASIIQDCLNQKSFRLTKLTFSDRAFSASYRYGGVKSVDINGVSISPENIASCSAQYGGATETDLARLQGKALSSGEVLTISCTRIAQTLADGRVHFEGGLIGVSTTADSAQFPLIRFDEPLVSNQTAESLSSRINELTADLRATKGRADRLEKQVAAIYKALEFSPVPSSNTKAVTYNGSREDTQCPPNSVLTEVRISYRDITDHPNGEKTCVSLKPEHIP